MEEPLMEEEYFMEEDFSGTTLVERKNKKQNIERVCVRVFFIVFAKLVISLSRDLSLSESDISLGDLCV